jgi:hypothetical protein
MTERGRFKVEVDPTVAPDGQEMVLLQLPDGHILMTAEDARRVAAMLEDAAAVVELEL